MKGNFPFIFYFQKKILILPDFSHNKRLNETIKDYKVYHQPRKRVIG